MYLSAELLTVFNPKMIPTTCVCMLSLQSCPTLCNAMDCRLPGSSVHGILQTGILEWAAMPSPPGDLPDPGIASTASPVSSASQVDSLPLSHPESPSGRAGMNSRVTLPGLELFKVRIIKKKKNEGRGQSNFKLSSKRDFNVSVSL